MPPKKRCEIPEGVPTGLWDILVSIKADTAATSQRVDNLEARVDEIEKSQDTDLRSKVDELLHTVDVLSARLDKCEKQGENTRDQIDELRAHSMKENIIINFDDSCVECKETTGEMTTELVRAFFGNVMGMNAADLYIPVAHRIGMKSADHIRAVIVKIPIAKERDMVMKHSNRLRDTRHHISKQMTAKQRERKRFILPAFKVLKATPDNDVKMVDDKLYIKGRLQTKYLPPVLPSPKVPNSTLTLEKGSSITDSGSTFYGYAARVQSIQEVSDALAMAREIPELAAANHPMFAYRVGTDDNCKENYHSDGDYGIGIRLLEHMTCDGIHNTLLVVARDCAADFRHIGNRRMNHAVEVCKEALSALTN